VEIRNPTSTRPWQHVLDPVVGYLMMVNNSLSGNKLEILNFGPFEKSLSVKEVVKIAAENWRSEANIIFGEDLSNLEARALELNSSASREKLSWQPVWTQQQAITESIAWWKDVLIHGIDAQERCKLDIEKLMNKISPR
jgi:CDP-glucose 4,6-dehydratase